MKIYFCVYAQTKQRVDMFLSTLFTDYSRSYIQKLIDQWRVQVNKKVISKNLKISPRDHIEIEIITQKYDIIPQNIPLDILYEDTNLVILNKDPKISVHPTPGENGKKDTLVNALLYHIRDLSGIGGVERPWIVHRLDKDTSGILLVAKNDHTMKYLQDIIKKRTQIGKYYLAIVSGRVKDASFKIESFIWRHPTNRMKMSTQSSINPKLALSHVKVIWYLHDSFTLVEVKIETGRTHQIRVHLSSIWFPIIWDELYWNKEVNKKALKDFWLTRQALHAYKIVFPYLWENKVFYAPLKQDLQSIIPKWLSDDIYHIEERQEYSHN